MSLVRVAYLFRTPINEVVRRVPQWELDLWQSVFDVYGALDWTRDDLHFASIVRTQVTGDVTLDDLTVYPDPRRLMEKERRRQEMTKDDVLAQFGVYENGNEKG